MRRLQPSDDFLDRLIRGAPLTAVRVARKMRGGSQSCLVECSDGDYYIVKMSHNPQGPNLLANEMLGNVCCRALALPVPDAAPVFLSAPFLHKHVQTLSFKTQESTYPPTPGLHFGSRLVRPTSGHLEEYLRHVRVPHLADASLAARMFILDLLTCNRDRRQTLFLNNHDRTQVELTFIDNGGMFGGPHWRFKGAPSNHSPQIDVSHLLSDTKRVAQWILQAQDILPPVINRILPLIPADWFNGDLRVLESTLYARLEALADLTASYPFMRRARDGSRSLCSGWAMSTEPSSFTR